MVIFNMKLTKQEFEHLVYISSNKYHSIINQCMLSKFLNVVYHSLEINNRIFVCRVDLRFAQECSPEEPDLPFCYQRSDPKVITRFWESLKSQLQATHKRRANSGIFKSPNYVWVKERSNSEHFHYHLMIFFDGDEYAFLGDYTNYDGSNIAIRIQKAWCSALRLNYPDYAHLVHFPPKPSYRLNRQEALLRSDNYEEVLFRLTYLAKERTKELFQGTRRWGVSITK